MKGLKVYMGSCTGHGTSDVPSLPLLYVSAGPPWLRDDCIGPKP